MTEVDRLQLGKTMRLEIETWNRALFSLPVIFACDYSTSWPTCIKQFKLTLSYFIDIFLLRVGHLDYLEMDYEIMMKAPYTRLCTVYTNVIYT